MKVEAGDIVMMLMTGAEYPYDSTHIVFEVQEVISTHNGASVRIRGGSCVRVSFITFGIAEEPSWRCSPVRLFDAQTVLMNRLTTVSESLLAEYNRAHLI